MDAVIAKTLESVPDAAMHWSTRTMAREAGLSQTESWPHSFEQIPSIFKWILRGQAASAEGRGSESKYTTSGVRVCRLEWGLRVL